MSKVLRPRGDFLFPVVCGGRTNLDGVILSKTAVKSHDQVNIVIELSLGDFVPTGASFEQRQPRPPN